MTERQTWHFTIELLPGSPGSERLLPVFRLLIGDDKLMKATKLESSKLDMDDPASYLAENYPVFQTRTRKGFPMFVHGRGGSHMLVSFRLRPRRRRQSLRFLDPNARTGGDGAGVGPSRRAGRALRPGLCRRAGQLHHQEIVGP